MAKARFSVKGAPLHQTIDAVLINPGKRAENYQKLGEQLAAIEPPLWCALIATHLRTRNRSVAIVDANAEDLSPDETAKRVIDHKPRLAVVVVYGHNPSASTQNMPAAGRICSSLKAAAPGLPLLMLGGHVAALPRRTLEEEDTDFVAEGEGVRTLTGLLDALESAHPDFSGVSGLWFRDGGRPVRSSKTAPLLDNLDSELPGPAWDLLPMGRYRAHNWHCFGGLARAPYASLYTSLGCPFHCTFCCIQSPFRSGEQASGIPAGRNSYRRWGPASVVRQLAVLAEDYGIHNVKFADEIFLLNPGPVAAVCNGIIERGLRLNIWAYGRVDTLSGIDLDLLRKAGIRWIALGIEAASDRVRKDVNKGYRAEDARDAVGRLRNAGIHVLGNYLFGLPEDDRDSMQATLDCAVELNCEFANFSCAMAYPGSALYDQALARKLALPATWAGYAQLGPDALPLPTKYCSGREVLSFRDTAFKAYFSSSRYLDMLESEFGAATREDVCGMVRLPLLRNSTA